MSKFLYDGPLEELETEHPTGPTGPKTPEGKEISSQNALRHGCTSKKVIIRGESEEEFGELLDDWVEEYGSMGKSARMLVEQAAEAQWVMRRTTNRYYELEQSLQEKTVLEWTEEDHKQMERSLRYRTAAERSFMRAVNTLEQMRQRRERRETERARQEAGEEKKVETREEEPEAEVEEVEMEMEASAEQEHDKSEAIHVLDQWVDVVVENGRAVTKLEPSNEQLLEDRLKMKPAPEQVCRRFHFWDGIPDEYAWCCETKEQRKNEKWGLQQMTVETWLQAMERERAAGTGHLSDTGEDLPPPTRRSWCWCFSCARAEEIADRKRKETEGEE